MIVPDGPKMRHPAYCPAPHAGRVGIAGPTAKGVKVWSCKGHAADLIGRRSPVLIHSGLNRAVMLAG